MSVYKNTVSYYTKGIASIVVSFPEDQVKCQYCQRYLKYEEFAKRYTCRITDERLLYPFERVGFECPLAFDESECE